MRDRAVDTVALIHRVLAWTFAVVGSIFLLAPNGTVRTINAVGSVFRVFPPAPESDLRFWLSLGVAYMALVTLLAARIAADPRANRPLMPILAAGKFTSSFTCLLFFVFSQPTFIYLLNWLVDGSIVLIVLGCYAWLGVVETTATGSERPSAQTETAADPRRGHHGAGGRRRASLGRPPAVAGRPVALRRQPAPPRTTRVDGGALRARVRRPTCSARAGGGSRG